MRSRFLSKREKEVLEFLKEGAQDKEVARKLGLSSRTANQHARNAFDRLGAFSRFQAGFLYGQMKR